MSLVTAKNAVLFDLGGTLARYYDRSEWPGVLQQAISQVHDYLRGQGLLRRSVAEVRRGVRDENYESRNHRVRPLEKRLARIFQLDESPRSDDLVAEMCRRFMKPIFALGHQYDDVLPVLQELRSRGLTTAVVSDCPWGSPAHLWREEIERFELHRYMDAIVFCTDVGWRKPAKRIFSFALDKLQALPRQCIFVGDDPRWDLVGPRRVGIDPVLIDRRGLNQYPGQHPIKTLHELLDRL